MTVHHYPDREAWLAARQATLGSSDAPVIMGVGFRADQPAHKSLYELWAEKTGKLKATSSDSARLRAGLYMEEGAAKELRKAVAPLMVVRLGLSAPSSIQNGFRAATPDSFVAPEDWLGDARTALGPGEFKTVEPIAADDWTETEPSAYALIQLHHQMGVGDWKEGWIGAWIGFGAFWHYHVPRNEDLLGEIWEAEERFWQSVQQDIPPAVDGSESCKRALRLLHPKDNGETMRVGPLGGWQAAAADLAENKRLLREMEEEVDRQENELRAEMGDATYLEVLDSRGGIAARFSWKHQTRNGYTVNPSESRVLRQLKVK